MSFIFWDPNAQIWVLVDAKINFKKMKFSSFVTPMITILYDMTLCIKCNHKTCIYIYISISFNICWCQDLVRTHINDVDMLYIEPLRPFQCYLNYKELSKNILKYEKEILLHGTTVSALDVVGLTCSVEMDESLALLLRPHRMYLNHAFIASTNNKESETKWRNLT